MMKNAREELKKLKAQKAAQKKPTAKKGTKTKGNPIPCDQQAAPPPSPCAIADRERGAASDASLGQVTALAQIQIEYENKIEKLEQQLKEFKEHHRRVSEESLPGVMEEVGLKDFTLTSGDKVTIKADVYAAITKANEPVAFQWLEDHKFGGLIKAEVVAEFAKGETGKAQQLIVVLQKKGVAATFSRSVHAQTLKAFLREQISAGREIPLELFSARPVNIAKIKRA